MSTISCVLVFAQTIETVAAKVECLKIGGIVKKIPVILNDSKEVSFVGSFSSFYFLYFIVTWLKFT